MDQNTTSLLYTILGILGTYLIIVCVWWVLIIVAKWKVFTKANEAGWKSLIPFYSTYITAKISWKTAVFWIITALGFVSAIASNYSSAADGQTMTALNYVCMIVGLVSSVALFYYTLKLNYHLAKCFNHGWGYAFGLTFLTPIFYLMLGFSHDEYHGPIVD